MIAKRRGQVLINIPGCLGAMPRFMGRVEHWRIALAVVAICGLTLRSAYSSPSMIYHIGVNAVKPSGQFGDVAGGGPGFQAGARRQIAARSCIVASIGSVAFGGVELFGMKGTWYGFPFKIGLEYSPVSRVFVTATAGAVWKVARVEYSGRTDYESEPGTLASVGIGAHIDRLDLICDYNVGNKNWKWFSVRVRWHFTH